VESSQLKLEINTRNRKCTPHSASQPINRSQTTIWIGETGNEPKNSRQQKKSGVKPAETGSEYKKPEVHPALGQPADQPITNNHLDRRNRKWTEGQHNQIKEAGSGPEKLEVNPRHRKYIPHSASQPTSRSQTTIRTGKIGNQPKKPDNKT
jgi:hypothetical protein